MAESTDYPATLNALYEDDTSTKTQYEPVHLTASGSLSILQLPLAKEVFGHSSDGNDDNDLLARVASGDVSYTDFVTEKVRHALHSQSHGLTAQQIRSQLCHIGLAALFSFLQSNVTGPPLAFVPAEVIIPSTLRKDASNLRAIRKKMIRSLSVDGEAAYQLTPNVELFCVAKAILVDADVLVLADNSPLLARTSRMRVNFLHQKMLSEVTGTLQKAIYNDLDELAKSLLENSTSTGEERARFLLERATIHTHHGFDAKARADLEQAAVETGFEYALTGRLGKRTKFQDRDISQLVVLAKSGDDVSEKKTPDSEVSVEKALDSSKPKTLDLNDDTLLESISFAKKEDGPEKSTTIQDESSLPASLASIDPSNQPKLSPLDSANLLAMASAITNTSPEHGLTREETLPYANRVIEGGSPNWQIYTQALLVRSRIEGYRSRTVERGVLQMQALVDQVIADTASTDSAALDNPTGATSSEPTTFLPRPEKSESASAAERLEYIWTLNFSTRWSLEAELASRWVNLGGLRTALEIYERLQMWAEVALCYAATDREDKAKTIVRRQLYERTGTGEDADKDSAKYDGPELSPLPADAPRLFCILGDMDKDASMYERAWEVSNRRYARAQRSLARLYLTAKPPQLDKAEEAYHKSLKINPLNHGAWFALGCVQLNLERWDDAVESFTRTVQIENEDAEAWSNLAAALLRVSSSKPAEITSEAIVDDGGQQEDDDDNIKDQNKPKRQNDPYKPKRDALAALHHAARLKQTDHRIWDNLLTVAASMPPSQTPYRDIILAQRHIIEIQGPKKGEKSIDVSILTMLVDYLVKNYDYEDLLISVGEDATSSGGKGERALRSGTIPGQILSLIDHNVVPLITHSAPLWLLVARVELFRSRPTKAFQAHEKAWRAVVASSTQGAFQMGDEKRWMDVVRATERLVREGYARIGPMEKEAEGKGDGEEEELVAKDWRFKARSAVRGILGKGKEFWEGTEGWDRLKELASEVSGGA
jgi:tetratricopeptide (TPR) repeat protein